MTRLATRELCRHERAVRWAVFRGAFGWLCASCECELHGQDVASAHDEIARVREEIADAASCWINTLQVQA